MREKGLKQQNFIIIIILFCFNKKKKINAQNKVSLCICDWVPKIAVDTIS